MSYDYDRLFAQIIASVTANGSIIERMHAVIKEGRKAHFVGRQ